MTGGSTVGHPQRQLGFLFIFEEISLCDVFLNFSLQTFITAFIRGSSISGNMNVLYIELWSTCKCVVFGVNRYINVCVVAAWSGAISRRRHSWFQLKGVDDF